MAGLMVSVWLILWIVTNVVGVIKLIKALRNKQPIKYALVVFLIGAVVFIILCIFTSMYNDVRLETTSAESTNEVTTQSDIVPKSEKLSSEIEENVETEEVPSSSKTTDE